MYRSLIERDRGGEFFIDRSPSKDLKELIVRPEWYGAKGDGATDDGTAIQAAITAGATEKKPVVLSGGNTARYLFTSTLTLYENTVILGYAPGMPGASAYGATLFFQPASAIPAMETNFIASYVGAIELKNFMLVGDGTYAYPTIAIDFTGASTSKIDKVGIQGPFTAAGILLDGVVNTTIDMVRISNFSTTQAMAAGILVKGTPWISTTTRIKEVYISGGSEATGGITDGIVCEGDAALGLDVKSSILESLARYTFNIHKGNDVDIYSPYVEDCPKTDAAIPIFRVDKDSLGATYETHLRIFGGVVGGPNVGSNLTFGFDVGSTLNYINLYGVYFARLKTFMNSTALSTSITNIDGCFCYDSTGFGTATYPSTIWYQSNNFFNKPPVTNRLSATYEEIPAYNRVSGQNFQATNHATNGIIYFWNGTAWVDAFGGPAASRDDALHVSRASTSLRPGVTVSDTTAMAADVGGGVAMRGKYTAAGGETPGAAIRARKTNGTTGQWGFGLGLFTRPDGSGDLAEVGRFTDAGNFALGTTAAGASATKTMVQKTGTAPSGGVADAFQQYSADAGAVAGQAGPHWRTEGGGIFGVRSDTGTTLQYVYQNDSLADDGTVNLPDATSGTVIVSCNAEAGMWLVQSDGTCTKVSGSTNTADTDADGSLCVYDGGTGGVVKNRLGAVGEIRIVYFYN